ncbi:MAG: hypothetical protein ACE361_08890 [Aureliella sp.]
MQGRQRRWMSATFTLACVAITAGALQYCRDHLGDESTMTGWTLLAATVGLYLLSLRKKLIRWKMGPVAGWLQMHAYLGSFASIVFLMHIGWPVRGIFESLLAFSFAFVSVSGIVLGYLSRSTPRKLAAIAQDHHLERIPALQASVAQSAHAVAIASADFGEGATLSEFYQRRLLPFFQMRRGLFYTLLPNGMRRRQLLRELGDLDRYLAEQGVESRKQLADMVCSKDDLDYHCALQTRLRALFTAHVALTWALAVMVGVHVVLVFRFQGAM